ncbi:hypothetical protein JTE90_028302 [Oedothorax gibbosus]|uniref:Uncharacterized protein n=1 Tax=Oedothorax gibbosus TaxID=931172 RepID=A0AAV6TE12_9ARAC|nr:hypothetical protein JTE90_028302 [Oedothorax gibbosus]
MHHTHQKSRKTLICQSSPCPGLVGFGCVESIERKPPLLVCDLLRQFLLSFSLQPTSPATQKLWFPGSCPACPLRNTADRWLASHLWLELGLVSDRFDPLTFVLDYNGHSGKCFRHVVSSCDVPKNFHL